MTDEEQEEDFQYIVRIRNTDLDGKKPVLYALEGIKGIGTRVAESIVRTSGISPMIRIGNLDDDKVDKLRKHIEDFRDKTPDWMKNRKKDPVTGENRHCFGSELDMAHREDINRMQKISCYKGVRHEKGKKVRGQRTKSNGRTGMELGVKRKELMRQQEED